MINSQRESLVRYASFGLATGFVCGLTEASVVNRAGIALLPFTALAYSILFGLGFLILGLIAKVIKRSLLSVAFALAVLLFVGLEVGFWINARANPFEEGSARTGNLIVIVLSLAVGIAVFFVVRKRHARLGSARFMRWVLLGTAILVTAYFLISSRASRPGFNCVLISVDALRADHLGLYGYSRPTSPTIDALGARGTLWLRDYTQSPGTTGGHAAMLTGLYTLSNGAYLNGYPLEPEVETLAEVFAKNGYRTAAFVNNWYLSTALGFGQGFDCFVDGGKAAILKDADPLIFVRGLLLYQVIRRSLVPPGAPTDVDVVDAVRWIQWRRNHRFFLFLHILDPHSPYLPPADLVGRFGGTGEALDRAYIESLHDKSLEERLTPEQQAVLVDRYDEEILSADRKIGRVLGRLQELGLLEKTLLIVTADHGEVLAERSAGGGKQFAHGTLDYGCLHVPLLMIFPGKIAAGIRESAVVENIDILATIVELLGLRDTARRQGVTLVGPVSNPWHEPGIAFATGDIEARDEYSTVTGDWQYTILGDSLRLGRVPLPGEIGHAGSANLIAQDPAVADSLQAQIETWVRRATDEAVVPYSLKGRSVTPGKEALQRLKALGYIH